MNRSEYTDFVRSIWMAPHEQNLKSLAVAGLGLIGECGEVAEAILQGAADDESGEYRDVIIEECGDVMYYATVLAHWKGYTVEDIWPSLKPAPDSPMMCALGLVVNAKSVSEAVKKFIRDDAEVDPSFMRNELRYVMASLWVVLMCVDADLHDALTGNAYKLIERYADAERHDLTDRGQTMA